MADHSEARERARQEFEKCLRCLYIQVPAEIADFIRGKFEEYEAAGRSLEQERDELRTQHRKVLLAIAANDMTKFRGGQKRRDGLKPSQAAEPGNIWNTPKEIAENALKHMDLEDLARVHKGDS